MRMSCIKQCSCLRENIKQSNIFRQIKQHIIFCAQADIFNKYLYVITFAQVHNLTQTADNTRPQKLLVTLNSFICMHYNKICLAFLRIGKGLFYNTGIIFLLRISKIQRNTGSMNRKCTFTPFLHLLFPIIILAKLIEEFNTILLIKSLHCILRKSRKE